MTSMHQGRQLKSNARLFLHKIVTKQYQEECRGGGVGKRAHLSMLSYFPPRYAKQFCPKALPYQQRELLQHQSANKQGAKWVFVCFVSVISLLFFGHLPPDNFANRVKPSKRPFYEMPDLLSLYLSNSTCHRHSPQAHVFASSCCSKQQFKRRT